MQLSITVQKRVSVSIIQNIDTISSLHSSVSYIMYFTEGNHPNNYVPTHNVSFGLLLSIPFQELQGWTRCFALYCAVDT